MRKGDDRGRWASARFHLVLLTSSARSLSPNVPSTEKARRPAVEAAVVVDACCWAERRADARRRAPESRRAMAEFLFLLLQRGEAARGRKVFFCFPFSSSFCSLHSSKQKQNKKKGRGQALFRARDYFFSPSFDPSRQSLACSRRHREQKRAKTVFSSPPLDFARICCSLSAVRRIKRKEGKQ